MEDPKKETVEIELPDKFKNKSVEDIQKEVETLEKEIQVEAEKVQEKIKPKTKDVVLLKKYLVSKGADCKHEKLVKVGGGFYSCEKCKIRVHMKIR